MSSFFLSTHLKQLKKIYSNPELELRILLTKSSKTKKDIIFSNFSLDDINFAEFKKSFSRRIKGEPLSKIYLTKSFWKYDFFVTTDVLDPRPETELIIENVLDCYPNKNKNLKILDICTGSGCLAISLAKEFPKSRVTATDISIKAIAVARKNANILNCSNQINFIKCNLLEKISTYDIVVSNPPYLSNSEYYNMSPGIRLHEPKVALLAKDSGYEFYTKISIFLKDILKCDSRAFIEIGSKQAKKTINILKLKNINCSKVVKDLQNLDRLLILNKSC